MLLQDELVELLQARWVLSQLHLGELDELEVLVLSRMQADSSEIIFFL